MAEEIVIDNARNEALAFTAFHWPALVELITLTMVAVSASAALIAVKAALRESRYSARAQRGQVFISLSERYAAPEINQAIFLLLSWRDAHRQDFIEQYHKGMKQRSIEALDIDQARRLLTTYFYDTLKLFELDILDQQLASQLVSNFGASVYVHICLPMGEQFYAQKDNILRRFLRIDPNFGESKLSASHLQVNPQ